MTGIRFFPAHVVVVEESGATPACGARLRELAAACAFVSVDLEFSGVGPMGRTVER
jgi:hypothetical protein